MVVRAKAILFDSDGVLVDSHELLMQAWLRLATEHGVDFEDIKTDLVGVPARETIRRYFPDNGADEAVQRIDELEIETSPATLPINGAIELTSSLPKHAWGIVTSASRSLGEARWSGAGIPLPSVIVTADDVTNGKPNPEPFILGAQKCGVEPNDCVVFEDSPAGGRAAAEAGAAVVAVGDQTWPFEPYARIPDLSGVSVAAASSGLAITFS